MTTATRILIVDDDPDFIDLLDHELNQFAGRYEVDHVETFEAGRQAIHETNHDLYLLDYQLDLGNSGADLLDDAVRRLRAAIILTGRKDEELGDRMMSAGACDFLMKQHVTGKLLDRVIRNVLARRKRLERVLRRQQELSMQIRRDPLTGLTSRSVLKQEIDRKLTASAHRGALLYVDLDGFKPVNDQYGHKIGDKTLQIVAARLVECVQSEDIVARLGGDEFVIYLQLESFPEHLAEATGGVADRLCASIAQPYSVAPANDAKPNTIELTASIGIALTPTDGIGYDELVLLADEAMYHAKKNGKNSFAFHQAPGATARRAAGY